MPSRRECVGEAGQHGVPALAVDARHAADVRVQVAVGEIAGGGELVDGRGVQVGGLLGDGAGAADALRRAQPAQPQPRRHDLGEAAQEHRAVLRARVGGDPRHPFSSYRSSPYGSSSTIHSPRRAATSATAARRAAGRVRPVGFWNVGTV